MARRGVPDADALDRAARLANGEAEPATNDAEPGEAELNRPVAPEAEPAPVVAEPAAEQPAADPVAEVEAPPVRAVHSKRQEIIERAKAKRLEESAAQEPAEEPVVEELPALPKTTTPAAAAPRALKVDHVQREVSQEEYDRAARLGLAVGNRLDALTNSLAEVNRRLANQPPAGQAPVERDSPASQPGQRTQPPQTRRSPPRQAADISDEELDRLGDLIVYGEADERRAALRELRGSGSSLTVEDVIEEYERRRVREDELAAAGARFAEANPHIVQDEGLVQFTVNRMQAIAIDEMRAINVPPEYLAQAATDPEIAFAYHKDLRKQGWTGLSQPEAISDAAAQFVSKRYRIVDDPAPAPVPGARPAPTSLTPSTQRQVQPSHDRRAQITAEKEQMRQPRRAAMIARTPAAPAPRSSQDVITGMRKARGYTTLPT
jgi:hypothetical protein